MRPEQLYLTDIVDAANATARFLIDTPREAFMADDLRQSAVLQKLIVIGEAAARLPASFTASHADVEWPDIVGFRNIAVHKYFSVDRSIVWTTATQDVPALRSKIAAILAAEFRSS